MEKKDFEFRMVAKKIHCPFCYGDNLKAPPSEFVMVKIKCLDCGGEFMIRVTPKVVADGTGMWI